VYRLKNHYWNKWWIFLTKSNKGKQKIQREWEKVGECFVYSREASVSLKKTDVVQLLSIARED